MNLRHRFVTSAAVATALLSLAPPHARAVTIDWVTVGNPGNANDSLTPAFGAVNYAYRIGKYEITIQQYTDFLNAVAATDTYSLYNPYMSLDFNTAGISRSGTSGGFTYSVIGPSGVAPAGASSPGNRPITWVSWFDAARFANWMHNGQGSGSTETGAYTLNGAVSGPAPARNPGATFSIPTENEWYKAAYYSPLLNAGTGGYYKYATQSNSAPDNLIGGGTNQANYRVFPYAVTQRSVYSASQNYLTEVGAFTNSASYYGTFDMTGNVTEWIDFDGTASSSRGTRGGDWNTSTAFVSSAEMFPEAPSNEFQTIGFRLASPVPEPATLAMASAGILFACGWRAMKRRRRAPAPADASDVTCPHDWNQVLSTR